MNNQTQTNQRKDNEMKTMNLFAAINNASTATSAGTVSEKRIARMARKYEKSLRLVRELSIGKRERKSKKDEAVKLRDINPGRTVQVVFMLLGMGMKREAIAQHVPDLAKRFDAWAGCGEAIMHAASAKKVDVNDVAHLFGLVNPEDKVVPSEPAQKEKTAAKKSATKKTSSRKRTAKAASAA